MKSIALRPWELAAYMREKKLLVVRPVKPQPNYSGSLTWEAIPDGNGFMSNRWFAESLFGTEYWSGMCPFGKPGEVLGIKEAWRATGSGQLSIDGKTVDRPDSPSKVVYRADGWDPGPWQPASRLPLLAIRHRPTIADIRVMRVGEMSEQDCRLAGCHGGHGTNGTMYSATPTEHFRFQWRKDHGKESLAANPWCWFMTCEQSLNQGRES